MGTIANAAAGGIDLGGELTTAGTALVANIGDAVGPALVPAVALLALFAGWRVFKRLSRG